MGAEGVAVVRAPACAFLLPTSVPKSRPTAALGWQHSWALEQPKITVHMWRSAPASQHLVHQMSQTLGNGVYLRWFQKALTLVSQDTDCCVKVLQYLGKYRLSVAIGTGSQTV